MFNVTIENNEIKSVEVDESSKDYFSQFNQEEFYGQIRDMIEADYENITISEATQEQYDVQEDGFTEPTAQPIAVGKTKLFG